MMCVLLLPPRPRLGMLAARLSVLRPRLALVDSLLHVRLEMADLTSAPGASPLLLQVGANAPPSGAAVCLRTRRHQGLLCTFRRPLFGVARPLRS
jgi:hypothetical protein